jgi:membrane protein DedA with SNARE-associated domain
MGTGSKAPRGWRDLTFYACLVVLPLSVFELMDIFELPFESLGARLFMSGSLTSVAFVTTSMAAWGYVGLFALMALESASLPVPSEVVLPFAGYLAFTGSMNLVVVVAVGTVAGLVGALADYYLALRLGRPVVERLFRWSGADPGSFDKAHRWISKKGAWTVLVARFVPGLRSVISLPAGALRMRLATFVPMTAMGAFGWTTLLVYVGYAAGDLGKPGLAALSPLVLNGTLVAAAVASACYIAYHLLCKWASKEGR